MVALGQLSATFNGNRDIPVAGAFRYNGAAEAGIGWLKVRTETAAVIADHPGFWTPEDCDWARQQANRLARPWGHGGPTPQEVWESRVPIPEEERRAFTAHWSEVNKEQTGYVRAEEVRALDREVTRLTLERSGLIEYRRRSISLPLKRFFLSKVSYGLQRHAETRPSRPASPTQV